MLAAPARSKLAGGVVVGAVIGTVIRYVALAAWPAPLPTLATTLLTVGLGCAALGALAAFARWNAATAVAAGFAGSVASLSICAAVAIMSSPLLCGVYVLSTPVSAIGGLGAGLAVGLAGKRNGIEARAIVDNA